MRAGLLCLALLLSQGLGLAHAVWHAPSEASQGGDWIGGVHEAGGTDCRLVDQLAQGDLLWAAAPALPVMVSGPTLAPHAPRRPLPPQGAAAYQARAPPRA